MKNKFLSKNGFIFKNVLMEKENIVLRINSNSFLKGKGTRPTLPGKVLQSGGIKPPGYNLHTF